MLPAHRSLTASIHASSCARAIRSSLSGFETTVAPAALEAVKSQDITIRDIAQATIAAFEQKL
jgi:hypothetical protein